MKQNTHKMQLNIHDQLRIIEFQFVMSLLKYEKQKIRDIFFQLHPTEQKIRIITKVSNFEFSVAIKNAFTII